MKTFIKHIFIAFLMLITGEGIANAQTSPHVVKVSGAIINDQNKPQEFATVSLLRAKDSAIVKGALSNDAGAYTFENVKNGAYIIKATELGYTKACSGPFTISDASANIELPVIKMTATASALKTVNITASKPLIERKIDRTVMNVENSVLAAGNSAMEILEKAPGVTVDKDDNISLKGKQGVTVMMDGKLTYLSSTQLASLLRATDGNTIQSIEIITNPSAKYDAAGNSGIINIKLKKNKSVGTNGSASIGSGYGQKYKFNGSVNANHKEGDLNVFGSYSYFNNQRPREMDISRLISYNNVNTIYDGNTNMLSARANNSYRLGADYQTSKRNTFGVLLSGYNMTSDDNNFTNTNILPNSAIPATRTTTQSGINSGSNNFAANINDHLNVDTAGKDLDFNLDYSHFNNSKSSAYNSYFYQTNGSQLKTPSILRNTLPARLNIASLKLDYTNPFSKTFKMEAGIKSSYVTTDNDLRSDSLLSNTWVNDAGRTNRFKYNENINAAYINFNQTWKKTSIQAGLRTEQTNSQSNSQDITGQPSIVNRHYIDLFPSVFFNHDFSDKHSVGLSYSRRIDRPDYDDMNSFAYYLDTYTYQQGNPFLKPQYTNSYELSYTYKKTFNATLGYSRTSDVISEVLIQNDALAVTYDTKANLAVQNNYSLNLNLPFTFAKWWNSNTNATGFYLGIKSDLAHSYLNAGQFAMNLNSNQTFTITKTLRAEASINYQSALTAGIFHIRSQYSIDGGVSKSFYNKRANLKLSMSDIFNTRKQSLTSLYGNVNLNINQKNETQVARLTFTYNFGSNKFAARKHTTGAEDEKNRVKSN